VRKQLATNDFNSTLFGVNPTSTAGSEAAIRQLTVDRDDRVARTQNRPPVAWIWAGIVSMVVVIVAVIFWTFNLTLANLAPNLSTDVPSVVGQSYEDGLATLEGNNLTAQKLTEPSSDIPENVIIRTDPASGIPVSPGTSIKVYVSTGEVTVAVPDVSSMLEDAAIAALEAKNLVYGTTTRDYSPDLPDGVVIRSDPAAGATTASGDNIREGDTVNLIVSNGLVNVPDVAGRSLKDANDALSALQLPVNVTTDGGCSGGTVSGQSVTGEQVQKTAVTLRVCSA
jgi:eukaryotic-like serine/threonine-protein kinase